MNWTASLLRHQLTKEREAHQAQLKLLASTSKEAKEYLELEAKLKQILKDLKASEENLVELKNQAESKEKSKEKDLETKEKQISNLEKKIKASKELVFRTKKEIRTNQLYYQQELRRVSQEYKAKLQPLKDQLALLKSGGDQLQKQVISQLEKINAQAQELTETKTLLSIYQKGDALSFFNTEPEQVIKVLQQHPTKLYYFFYSTVKSESLDLSNTNLNLEDSSLFFGTFGEGALKVSFSESQSQKLEYRIINGINELFSYTKNKLFTTDSTRFLYKKEESSETASQSSRKSIEFLKERKKPKKPESVQPSPAGSAAPSVAEETKKKKGFFRR